MVVLKILCFIITTSCVLASPVRKYGDNSTNYRLPKIIAPSTYQINISLFHDGFHTKHFEGTVAIAVNIKNSTKEIQLHASKMEIFRIEIRKNQTVLSYANFQIDNETEILTIATEESLEIGNDYVLTFGYIGILSDDVMNGFYQSTYEDADGNTEYLATTQFESTFARNAFPCFDEPEFKAKFTLTLTYPADYKAISNTREEFSNTADSLITTKFEETQLMSTYAVAFIISKFISKSDGDYAVWAKPGSENNLNIALEQGPKLLEQLGNFTGIGYYNLGIDKMDVAAIPDFAAGAMENWGLVTYREVLIIDDQDDTSNLNQQNIIITIAHEFAHMWFGNYVTLKWWSDTWLNEGFATFMEYLIAHEVNPDYEFDKQFLLNVQQDIFQTDTFTSTQPLSSTEEEINTPVESSNKFSLISYSKGASIIRMMYHFLGDKFQTGMQEYLNSNALNNTVPKNVWDAIDKQNLSLPNSLKMTEIMENWVNKAGFPIVTVTLSNKRISMSQKRYLLGDDKDDTNWYIPISYTLSNDSDKFTNTKPKEWILLNKTLTLNETLDDKSWIVVNNQGSGYYRVNYDTTLWKRINTALKNDQFDGITDLNRAQIVDDIFNLAKINEVPYSTAFGLADYLVNETNYYAWSAAFNSFSYLIKRTGTSELGKAISTKVVKLMDALYKNATTTDDTHIGNLTQVLALQWGCYFGMNDCIVKAQQDFANYKKDPSKRPDSNFRSVIYCTALRSSTNSTDDWNFLWTKYTEATSSADKNTILSALGCTKDITIINAYLNKSIDSSSGVKKQDGFTVFKSVYSGNPEGVDIAYNFLKNNHEKLAEYFKATASLFDMLSGVADLFTTEAQVTDLQKFVETENLAEDFKLVAQQALDKAKSNIKWTSTYEKQLNEIFNIDGGNDDGKGSANSIQISFSLLFSIILCIKVYVI